MTLEGLAVYCVCEWIDDFDGLLEVRRFPNIPFSGRVLEYKRSGIRNQIPPG